MLQRLVSARKTLKSIFIVVNKISSACSKHAVGPRRRDGVVLRDLVKTFIGNQPILIV